MLLPVVSIAPIAHWTSGCNANWWNTVWIGFAADIVCTAGYAIAYGHNHPLDPHKFNLPEYLALGVAPAAISSLIYNRFLDCDSPSRDQGSYYILPVLGQDKSVALNFRARF